MVSDTLTAGPAARPDLDAAADRLLTKRHGMARPQPDLVLIPADAIVGPKLNTHPDAALIELANRWREADAAYVCAADHADAVGEALAPIETPKEMFRTARDFVIGIADLAWTRADGRSWYPIYFGSDTPSRAKLIAIASSNSERGLRAKQIADACEKYATKVKAEEDRSGYTAASDAARRLASAVGRIEAEIAGSIARTADGIRVKAVLVHDDMSKGSVSSEELLGGLIRDILATFPAPPLVATSANTLPDAELLRLGQRMDEAWAAERATDEAVRGLTDSDSDELWDAAYERTKIVVDEIEELPATTLDGLKVKARACSWCRNGEAFEDGTFNDQATTDVRLASAIVRDLLAMGGGA